MAERSSSLSDPYPRATAFADDALEVPSRAAVLSPTAGRRTFPTSSRSTLAGRGNAPTLPTLLQARSLRKRECEWQKDLGAGGPLPRHSCGWHKHLQGLGCNRSTWVFPGITVQRGEHEQASQTDATREWPHVSAAIENKCPTARWCFMKRTPDPRVSDRIAVAFNKLSPPAWLDCSTHRPPPATTRRQKF